MMERNVLLSRMQNCVDVEVGKPPPLRDSSDESWFESSSVVAEWSQLQPSTPGTPGTPFTDRPADRSEGGQG